MNTIRENITKTFVIKKSKFITKLFFISDIDEINYILTNIKKEYKDASHICYAYICDNNIKFNDDFEPNNTAGIPIYNVLKNNNLNHTLAIVIRYFGGIKLGANGLVRAYSNCVSDCLNNNITQMINGYILEISFDYNDTKCIEYILKDFEIVNKNFDTKITIEFTCPNDKLNDIKSKLDSYINNFNIKKQIVLKK